MASSVIAELEVLFQAQTATLQKQLDQMQASLKKTDAAAAKANKAVGSGMTKAANDASKSVGGLRQAAENARKGIQNVEQSVAGLTRGFKAFLALEVVQVVGNIVGSAVELTKAAVTTTAELGRLATQAGVTVEQFQELHFAMRESGVAQQEFAQASATLARNLSELQSGTGPLLDYLRQSQPELLAQFQGVTDVNQAWSLLSDALANMPSAHERVRFAQVAVSESGARMIRELSAGSKAIDENRQRLNELGGVMSERTVKQAQELEDQFRKLSLVIGTSFKNAVVGAAEALGIIARATHPASVLLNDQARVVNNWYNAWQDSERKL